MALRFLSNFFKISIFLYGSCVGNVHALSFEKALQVAKQNDPTFLIAQTNLKAAKERSRIALATLLPQLNISANSAINNREYITEGTLDTIDKQKFKSNNAQVNLTQALWRHAEYVAYQQSDLSVLQGEAQLLAAEHDLYLRFLQAWFDVMAARDHLQFTAKQSDFANKMLAQMRRAYSLELAAQPELEEVLARNENAKAELTTAEGDLEIKIASIEQIVGPIQLFSAPYLAEDPRISDPPTTSLHICIDMAESANPAIIAATLGLRAANEEIKKQRAGHGPTLDMTGSYGRTYQGAGTTPSQQGYTNTQGTLGLQLNIPIYSGGGQSAKVREAMALMEKTAHDLENTRRTVRQGCKQAWFGLQSGIAQYKATSQAVKSASVNLQVASAGEMRELKSNLDVLRAYQQLQGAIRDMNKAHYAIIFNKIKLKATAGLLAADDLTVLNAALAPLDSDSAPHSKISP